MAGWISWILQPSGGGGTNLVPLSASLNGSSSLSVAGMGRRVEISAVMVFTSSSSVPALALPPASPGPLEVGPKRHQNFRRTDKIITVRPLEISVASGNRFRRKGERRIKY